MDVGNYLVVKKDAEQIIRSGDGIVGKMELKKGERYEILYVSVDISQVEIRYKKSSLWFSVKTENDYFLEHYEKYFYNYTIGLRKNKLEKLNEA